MDFPSNVSEVSDICDEYNNKDSDLYIDYGTELTPVFSRVYVFPEIKQYANAMFPKIFNLFQSYEPYELFIRDKLCLHIPFIWGAFSEATIVYSLTYVGKSRWQVCFEPFECSPFEGEINWIKLAYVNFDPVIYDFTNVVKKIFSEKRSVEYH